MQDSESSNSIPSSLLPNLSGIVIDEGRLRLLNAIGRGAWGVVYCGEDTANPGHYCAVKCMMVGLMTHHQQSSIAHEVTMHTICAKSTPCVVQILNVIEDDDSGMLYIVTELCDGGDLLDQICTREFIGDDEHIRRTYLQVLEAVEACHRNSVFHRDLKPENILVKDGGKTVVLGDFGFATRKRSTMDFRLGSEPFMSPEVRGGAYAQLRRFSSSRADIWALGIILVNLITGYIPWAKASGRDPHFVTYALHDPDFLYHTFAISRGANEILKSIFTLDPCKRTSIPELRGRILECETFGRCRISKPQITVVTKRYVKEDIPLEAGTKKTDTGTLSERKVDSQREHALLHVDNTSPVIEADITDAPRNEEISVTFPVISEDLQEPQTVETIPEDEKDKISIEVIPAETHERDITDGLFLVGCESDGDASTASGESEMPITPETYAVDDAVVVDAGGAPGLENLDDLVEIELGNAGTPATKRADSVATARIKVNAQGEKGPFSPLRLEPWRNDGAAFAPPKQPRDVRWPEGAYKVTTSHPAMKRVLRGTPALRVMIATARLKNPMDVLRGL